jgi:hypothetical protein
MADLSNRSRASRSIGFSTTARSIVQQEGSVLYPMSSRLEGSAMMCSRKPALVDPFSSKAELDCMPYRKEELGITNPILWKPVSRNKSQN